MKTNKLLKFICFIIVIVFLCSYFIEQTGYYEYKLQNKKILTEKEMKQFELDVKEGKEIDINDYLINDNNTP